MIRRVDPTKIQLYATSKYKKMRACDVRSATGSSLVINGTLFNWKTWKPTCDVKAHGKMLSDDPYSYRGLAWNDGDDHFTVALTADCRKFDNFISCVFLLNDGKPLPISVTPDVARPAGRTAIFGKRDGSTWVWCTPEGKHNLTPGQLCREIQMQGNVDWALMLDGGGSSQLSQEGDKYVYSSRKVQNYICFWEDQEQGDGEPEGDKPVVEINAYSLSRDGNKKVSEHFRVREFACKNGADTVLIARTLPLVCEYIRMRTGKAWTPNSAYRTPEYNAKLKDSSPRSQHTYGCAADIPKLPGFTIDQMAAIAREIMPDWGGVGRYTWGIHVDVRDAKSDWDRR